MLYERYGAVVYRIALRLAQDTADAEDVVQEIFLGLPRALRSFRGSGSLEGWIKRIAVRTTLMRLRSQRRRREAPLEAGPVRSDARGPASVVDRIAMERALEQLAEPLCTVFVLKVIEGYGHEEISEMLGITVESSRTRLARARKSLRKSLS